jgi:hypothetical protein
VLCTTVACGVACACVCCASYASSVYYLLCVLLCNNLSEVGGPLAAGKSKSRYRYVQREMCYIIALKLLAKIANENKKPRP